MEDSMTRQGGYFEGTLHVAGEDEEQHKLAAVLPGIFTACKQEYLSRPDMTGAELYAYVCK
jgi:hypothetical protein